MKRRIVIVESASEMGGVEYSTLYLASRLDPDHWEAVVVCPGEGRLSNACRQAGVPVRIVPMPSLRSTSFRVGLGDFRLPDPFSWLWNAFVIGLAAMRLGKFLRVERPNLVLTKGVYAHLCGGLASRWTGNQCIWHVQDLISERYRGWYRKFFGLLAQILPHGIVTDGTPIAEQLPNSIHEKLHLVFNGVDTTAFQPGLDGSSFRRELGIGPDRVVIGHAARLTPWKGQHHLLEAFGGIADRYPQTSLLLVGSPLFDDDAYDKRVRARTRKMGLEGRVIFAGFRDDLPVVLAGMDIFAYPSVEKDTSPLSLISAMACGLPVSAFDIRGVREVLGDAGLLVPVGDRPALAASLTGLIEDPRLRKRLGEHARRRAAAEFSLEGYVAKMQGVFERYAN